MAGEGDGSFKHDFLGCCSAPGEAVYGYFCGCFMAKSLAEKLGEESAMSWLNCLCYPLLLPLLRNKVREQNGVAGNLVYDAILSWYCPCCAVIQLDRELKE